MTTWCPSCLEVEVSPKARDGRCDECRPQPKRAHSEKRQDLASQLQSFVHWHNRASQ